MSIGNATQAVNFDRSDFTLILGENLDAGGGGARNGVGKSSMINALCYVLYGQPIISGARANSLINRTNEKNMLVSVDFEIDGVDYRIERGRKPNILKFYKNNIDVGDQQGENKDTQEEINHILGMSHSLFKHTVTLNTATIPFLLERASEQRLIIEELFGMTLMSEKSEKLKLKNKDVKDEIQQEEYRISAIKKSNEHIQTQITNMTARYKAWNMDRDKRMIELENKIESLTQINSKEEIRLHEENEKILKDNETKYTKKLEKYHEQLAIYNEQTNIIKEYNSKKLECDKWIVKINKDIKATKERISSLNQDIELLLNNKCHACGQPVHDDKLKENIKIKKKELQEREKHLSDDMIQLESYQAKLNSLGVCPEAGEKPIKPVADPLTLKLTYYKSKEEAYKHDLTLESYISKYEELHDMQDPYIDQIRDLEENGIQKICYKRMDELIELNEHQNFLLKLLTNKDSFIRKKIIEHNLAYLNSRLIHYLRETGLPHSVRFMPDLTVNISEMGRELPFGMLSTGERNRVILSLSLAFRDVWESLYNHINLLFIDELIDNGLDTQGVEYSVKVLKYMARDRHKSVWLVSHREELLSRVHNTLKVIKTSGFTEYNTVIE